MSVSSIDLAHWFAQHDDHDEPDRTPMKILKLIYFAQAHYLAATGQPLVNEKTFAWAHGPVYTPARHLMSDAGAAVFRSETPVEFDEPTEAFLRSVDAMYGRLTAAELRRISHMDSPYADVYDPEGRSIVIPDEAMIAFYRLPEQSRRWIDHDEMIAVDEDLLAALDEVDIDAATTAFRSALSA